MIFSKSFLKYVDLVVALILCLYLPIIATSISNRIFLFASPPWNYLHHFLQMFFALILMVQPCWRKSLHEWGFNIQNLEYTRKIFKQFCIGYIICLSIGTIISQILSGWSPILDFPLTWKDFLVNLSFSVTMPGVSEEILFRALSMGILSRRWNANVSIGNFSFSLPNLFSSIFFTLAHVGFSFFPFQIVYYNSMQLIFAFSLGLLYGYVYEETGSLLGPILLHNASDGIAISIYFLISKLVI